MTKAFISGCSGLSLTQDEVAFFQDERPWGLILFARNLDSAAQIRELTAAFRDAVDEADAPVLIDQEGGRVQRLRPPLAPRFPCGRAYGRIYEADVEKGLRAAWLGGYLIGRNLIDLGITVDCLPLVDLGFDSASDVIGDRAYSSDPAVVSVLGEAAAAGLSSAGVLPIVKHIPGHGRAQVDSHLELPIVDASREDLERMDFVPFSRLNEIPLAMTAHVVYSAIDPKNCATLSKTIINEIIRGHMSYDGCLMGDDISMKALNGALGDLVRGQIDAGCDLILHCNGDLQEMREVALAAPELSGKSLARAERALAARVASLNVTRREEMPNLWREFESLTGSTYHS